MKKNAILLCLLAFALSACKPDPEPEPEPAPNNGGQNNDTRHNGNRGEEIPCKTTLERRP